MSTREDLLDKTLREYAQELRMSACAAWSDVMRLPEGIDEARCQYATALENRLKSAIDELADELDSALVKITTLNAREGK